MRGPTTSGASDLIRGVRGVFKWWRVVALVAIMSMTIAACSGDEAAETTTTGVPGTEATSTQPPTTQAATTTTQAEPTGGGTLVVGPIWDIGTMDPTSASSSGPRWHGDGVLQGLTRYKPGTWDIENDLAESLDVSDDGLVISFKLREGIQFQKGYGELTAEDVKYSFERAAGMIPLYPDATEDDVSQLAGEWSHLVEVNVTGTYTGEIVLDAPSALIQTLVLPYSPSGLITSKAAVEDLGRDIGVNPVGTGPYEVTSWDPGVEIDVQRFADYVPRDGESYEWDEIRYILSEDSVVGATPTVLLEAGDADVTPFVSPRDFARLQDADGLDAVTSPTLSYVFMQMNVLNPKMQDPRIREAIRYAIDVPALIQLADADISQRANAVIAPNFAVGSWSDAPVYERDVDHAKELLSEAGADGLELGISLRDTATGELIQSQLAEAGITVTILSETPDGWWSDDPSVSELTYWQYSGAPDPAYQLEWMTCDQIGSANPAHWCNEEYSSLWEELGTELDPARRNEIAIQMQQLMDEGLGYVWIYYPNYYHGYRDGLQPVLSPAGDLYPTLFTSG